MKELILAIDDESRVLSAYQRNLGDQFHILTVESPEQAIAMLHREEFAVIMSDLRMPGMDGISLLSQAREIQPDAVRIMISGHADMTDAINSVKQAGIFRLLIKPCPPEEIAHSLDSALKHHRLIKAEKALLEQTLNGAIQTLTDILAILDAQAFGQAQLRRDIARTLAVHFNQAPWEFEIAALMAEIGRATLPTSVNEKLRRREKLSDNEQRLVDRIPEFSHQLLAHIPRLEGAVQSVLYQNKNYDGSGFPEDDKRGQNIPLGGRCLRAINALLTMHQQGIHAREAISTLRMGPEKFDPAVVTALFQCAEQIEAHHKPNTPHGPQQTLLKNLVPGMVLLADIVTSEGMVVLGAGTKLSGAQIQRIQNFAHLNRVVEPLLVEFAG